MMTSRASHVLVVLFTLAACAAPRSVLRLDPNLSAPPPDTLSPDEFRTRLIEIGPSLRACGLSQGATATVYAEVNEGALANLSVTQAQNPDCVDGAVRAIRLASAEQMSGASFFLTGTDTGLEVSPIMLYSSLKRAEIYAPVLVDREEIQRCGEAANAVGRIVIRWTVQGDGRISNVRVADDAGSPEAARCIARLAPGWRPRPPRGGGIVHVTMPFDFEVEPRR